MQIEVPIRSISEATALLDAGGDIFYGGVVSKQHQVNNRDNSMLCQVGSFSELHDIIRLVHSRGKRFYLTLNSNDANLEECKTQIEQSILVGVDRFIVADLRLVEFINNNYSEEEVILSVLSGIQNAGALGFYLRDNVKGFCFERNVSPFNMERVITAYPILEATAFASGNCQNTQRICQMHNLQPLFPIHKNPSGYTNLICEGWYYERIDTSSQALKDSLCHKISSELCSLCALPILRKVGVRTLKIEGRELPISYKLKRIQMLKKTLNLLEKEKRSNKENEALCQVIHLEYYGYPCNAHDCFYENTPIPK